MESNLNVKYESVTADVRYESAENYSYLEKNNQKAYIKPQTYEKFKTKKFKSDISKCENMSYDDNGDFYICAVGWKLSVVGTKNKKAKSRFTSLITVYECENCNGCLNKDKCTKAKGNKKLYVAKDFLKQREISLDNISSIKAKILRLMNMKIRLKG